MHILNYFCARAYKRAYIRTYIHTCTNGLNATAWSSPLALMFRKTHHRLPGACAWHKLSGRGLQPARAFVCTLKVTVTVIEYLFSNVFHQIHLSSSVSLDPDSECLFWCCWNKDTVTVTVTVTVTPGISEYIESMRALTHRRFCCCCPYSWCECVFDCKYETWLILLQMYTALYGTVCVRNCFTTAALRYSTCLRTLLMPTSCLVR